jgi:hypothetical protein
MPARRAAPRRKRQTVQRRLLRPAGSRVPGRTRPSEESASAVTLGDAFESLESLLASTRPMVAAESDA